MIKGYIFDLDGTLADTVESIAHAVNKALIQEGFQPRPVEEYNYYAGDGMDKSTERALKAAGDQHLEHLLPACIASREYFRQDPLYHVKPYQGIPEILDTLKTQDMKIAVLSNKPHKQAIQVVETLFGTQTFDWIQGQEESVPKKPDPTGALLIAEKWGIHPSQCMYMGDTNTDMQTAVAAHMNAVGVTWGFRTREELIENGAQYLADQPADLLQIQEEINDQINRQ